LRQLMVTGPKIVRSKMALRTASAINTADAKHDRAQARRPTVCPVSFVVCQTTGLVWLILKVADPGQESSCLFLNNWARVASFKGPTWAIALRRFSLFLVFFLTPSVDVESEFL